jgi:hypothetical protein
MLVYTKSRRIWLRGIHLPLIWDRVYGTCKNIRR